MTDHDWPHSVVNGIFRLNSDPDLMAKNPQPGDDIVPLLGLDDHVVEFEITPNRPDCLSVIGLARESAATFNVPPQPARAPGEGHRRHQRGRAAGRGD